MSVFIPLITILMSFATILIAWIGANGVSNGTMEIGTIMGAISYALQILMGFSMATMVILAIPRGQISAKRINEVLDMPLSITDRGWNAKYVALPVSDHALVFEDVSFRYRGAAKKTLENINLTVQPGQTLAIIGSTGDGKTTLVNLVSRLYDVENGSIRLMGTDIRDIEQKKLRDAVSFAPQKSTLFFGTIRSNMQMAQSAGPGRSVPRMKRFGRLCAWRNAASLSRA
jgi:ATP-binding cassette subfamily B protein